MDQVKPLVPGDKGNGGTGYRAVGGAGYQDATTLDGSYGSIVAFPGTTTGDEYAEMVYPDDGSVWAISSGPAFPGFVGYKSVDNGNTYAAGISIAGLTIAQGGTIDFTQLDFVDLKPLGLWTPSAGNSTAALMLLGLP